MHPKFFPTQADFLQWFEQNHLSETELLVGFYKKGSGKPSITWPESVNAALRFGWIDGIRRRIDEHSYTIRFTPRRPRSIWSMVNIKQAEQLIAQDLMNATGVKAFEARSAERSAIYSFEQTGVKFSPAQLREFRSNKEAWAFFQEQPPSYQRPATWWVLNAKREETKVRRLTTLIADSAAQRRLRHLTPTNPRKADFPSRKTRTVLVKVKA